MPVGAIVPPPPPRNPPPQGCVRLGETVEAAPEAVTQAVGGGCQRGYCRLQMPLKLAFAVKGTVTGHRLGTLEGGGGASPPSNASVPPSV